MMKTTAATTLSSAAIVLAMAASSAQAEPTPSLHGLAATVAEHEKRITELESELDRLHGELSSAMTRTASYQQPAGQGPRTYIIQTGDTVSEIARKHNCSRAALMSANQLKEGQQIYIGDELIIPAAAGGSSRPSHHLADSGAPAPKPTPSREEPSPTVDTRKPAPAPAPAPAPQPSGNPQFVSYKVKQGDSLSGIARSNGVSVDAIVQANGLRNANVISVNQTLRIPVGGSATASAPAPSATYAASTAPANEPAGDDYSIYTVQKGDTLWSLARDFFTSQQEIQQLNNMGRSTILRPGQELVVPTKKYFEYHSRLSEAS